MYKLYLAPDSPLVVMYSAHVDYVRLTHKRGTGYEEAAQVYQRAAYACMAEAAYGELSYEPWYWLGYYGTRGGPVAYGAGVQGCILQVSGARADSVLQHQVPFDNVARLDIAYTVWLSEDSQTEAKRCGTWSKEASNITHGGKWAVKTVEGYGDGDTTYVGSRGGAKFYRIYDKGREGREDDTYRNAWRFELEFSGDAARALWPDSCAVPPQSEYWAGVVCQEFRRRGVPLRRPPDAARVALPSYPKPDSSADRRLRWLRNQVAPAIEKLEAAGVSRRAILDALGYDVATVQQAPSTEDAPVVYSAPLTDVVQ